MIKFGLITEKALLIIALEIIPEMAARAMCVPDSVCSKTSFVSEFFLVNQFLKSVFCIAVNGAWY